jgi:hypothetical protein
MEQVRIFTGRSYDFDLEARANEWLKSKGDSITITRAIQSHQPPDFACHDMALSIFYTEK